MEEQKTIKVWVDGGSSGNPGKSAIAFVIIGNNLTRMYANLLKNEATNNEAEYLALIKALMELLNYKINFSDYHLVIHSDSQLVVNQVKGLWSINKEKFVK